MVAIPAFEAVNGRTNGGIITMLTVGFMPHLLEILPIFRERMARHDMIILEEPESPHFMAMLLEKVSIEDYLLEADPQFPEFAGTLYAMMRQFRKEGKAFLQVDPYMDVLASIHEHLADGGSKDTVLQDPVMKPVYIQERQATGCLIRFYHHSSVKPFPDVVSSVLAFARADATRILLRDQMRALRISELCRGAPSIFIEAGYIHYTLYRWLKRLLRNSVPMHVDFLLGPAHRALGAKRRNLSPGDILTLTHALGRPLSFDDQRLLAARSLIYIKMIHKTETSSTLNGYPVTEHEIFVNGLVDELSYDDCQVLFSAIKHADPPSACNAVLSHMSRKRK